MSEIIYLASQEWVRGFESGLTGSSSASYWEKVPPTIGTTTEFPLWWYSGDYNIYGKDYYNFDAVTAGIRGNQGVYFNNGFSTYFGTSTPGSTSTKFYAALLDNQLSTISYNEWSGYNGFSIRLTREATSGETLLSDGEIISSGFTDIDGNVYSCVKIGTQIWTRENLRVINGYDYASSATTSLVTLDDHDWWYNTSTQYPAYAEYPIENIIEDYAIFNLPFTMPSGYTQNDINVIYGRIYCLFAANTLIQNNPDGWRVPLNSDFETMTSYMISVNPNITIDNVGDALKSIRHADYEAIKPINSTGYVIVDCNLVVSGGTMSGDGSKITNISATNVVGIPTNYAPSDGAQYLTVEGKNVDSGINGEELQTLYDLAKSINPSSNNPINIIIYPGYYGMSNGLSLDTPYINLISATGELDVKIEFAGAIVISDNIKLTGIFFGGSGLKLTGNFPGLWIENCSGMIDGGNILTYPDTNLSGTFKDINLVNGNGFGYIQEASGYFENIYHKGGNLFYDTKIISGIFKNCNAANGFGVGGAVISSGATFENCTCDDAGFGGGGGCIISSGTTFINCNSGDNSFGNSGIEVSGTFINCNAGNSSFGAHCMTSGTFVNCTAKGNTGSFGDSKQGGTLTGSLYNCRLTTPGTFGLPSSGGTILLCIDGYGAVIGAGDFAPSDGNQYLTVKGISSDPGTNGAELQNVYNIAKALNPTIISPINIIIYPGYYGMTSLISLDTPYINLISSTGELDIEIGYSGILIITDNIKLIGINFTGMGLEIRGNFPGLRIENCSGQIKGSTIDNSTILSGTFKNLKLTNNTFGSGVSDFPGHFENITSDGALFNGENGDLSGRFINCTAETGFSSTSLSGTFINCNSGDFSFGTNEVGANVSGTFINCTAGNTSFGIDGIASGTFINCTAKSKSFGDSTRGGALTGSLYNCRLTTPGTFEIPSSGGTIILCIDGYGKIIGGGDFAPTIGTQFLTVKGGNSNPGINGNELQNVYNIAKAIVPAPDSPVNIIIYPGYYSFLTDSLNLDTQNINLVSSTGNIDVNIGGSGVIITNNKIKINGINFIDGGLKLTGNFPELYIENCSGQIQADTTNGDVTASGTFKNINITMGSGFSGIFNCSGIFKNIFSSNNLPLFSSSIDTLSGTFTDVNSVLIFQVNNLTGTFLNCKGNNGSFNGICSGTFTNCEGLSSSFTTINGGTYNNCVGQFVEISGGKLYYCKKNDGSYPTPINGGEIHLCIDGNGITVDSSIIPQSLSLSKIGANSTPSPQRFQWITDKTISRVLLTTNCSGVTVSISDITYDEITLVGVTLPALTDLVILDIAIQTGYDNANAIIIF